jgi:hypothetical protein
VTFELKITSDAKSVLSGFSVDVQEDLWDLFEQLVQSTLVPSEPLDFEIEMHRFTTLGAADQVVVILFPVVTDYRAKTVSIPWLLPVS